MPDLVYVLRWRGFEKLLRTEKPYHETMIEMTLGEHIVDRVVWESGAPRWINLWAFEFKEVDSDGRRVYEAAKDPYESVVEEFERQKLVQWRLTRGKLKEGAKDAGSREEG